jgi:ABC-type antimicrobial peptide transport system permease subunit
MKFQFEETNNQDYYVNPSSEEILELGTKAYPFKNIGVVFLEILNFYSNTDSNVSIFIKEYTKNQLLHNTNYVVNMTNVNIQTYTDDLTKSIPGPAELVFTDKDVDIISKQTRFNIVKDLSVNNYKENLRLEEIKTSGTLTSKEK